MMHDKMKRKVKGKVKGKVWPVARGGLRRMRDIWVL